MHRSFASPALLGVVAMLPLAACSANGLNGLSLSAAPAYETSAGAEDSVKRTTPVVPGRRARVFIMAGLGTNCEPIDPPAITITQLARQRLRLARARPGNDHPNQRLGHRASAGRPKARASTTPRAKVRRVPTSSRSSPT